MLGALLAGAPLAVVRFQLLEAEPSLAVGTWVAGAWVFPAGFFLVLCLGLSTSWRSRLLLAAATGGYIGFLLIHHLYFAGRGGLPHLRQLSQLEELRSVFPMLLPLVDSPTVFLALAPILGVGLLRHSGLPLASAARPLLLAGGLGLWTLTLLLSYATSAAVLEYRTGALVERLRVYEPNQMVAKLGLVGYWQDELLALVRHRRHPIQQDFPGTVRELLGPTMEPSLPLQPPTPRAQQNLIWIQMESLDPTALEGRGGDPAMPFLHGLSQDEIYFPNFWAQHSGGGTSDAELSALTSLLPLATHAGLQTLDSTRHLALPELLKRHGYKTLAFHGYRPSYYGRNQYLPKIGFETFHAGQELTGLPATLPLSDQPMFDAALPLILSTAEPFFALIITVQGHGPHTDTASYLREMRHLDRSLERFITGLRRSGLLQRTTVFLYGDHLSNLGLKTSGKERVPFLLVSPHREVSWDTTAPASHLDLAPTALSLLGLSRPEGWLGSSLLGTPVHQPVVLFNDLTALRIRTPLTPKFVDQPQGLPALLYSASQLDP